MLFFPSCSHSGVFFLMYFLCFSKRRWTDEWRCWERCCMWYAAVGPLLICFSTQHLFIIRFISFELCVQSWHHRIISVDGFDLWPHWRWSPFLTHTTHKPQSKSLLFCFPFYWLFWASSRKFLQAVHLITYLIFTHPYVVFSSQKEDLGGSLCCSFPYNDSDCKCWYILDICDGYEKEYHKSWKLL